MIVTAPLENIHNCLTYNIIASKLDKYLHIDISSHVHTWLTFTDDIMIISEQFDSINYIQYYDELVNLINTYDIIYLTGIDNVVYETLQTYVISQKFIKSLNNFMSKVLYDIDTPFPEYKCLKFKVPIVQSFVRLFDNYKYYHNRDSVSGDFALASGKTVDELCDIVNNDTQLIAFNTLGYIKISLNDQLINLPSGGIYIKQTNNIIYDRINNIINRTNTLDITFTITTCKRWPLFKKTMDALLLACADLHLIKEFICIDDNSDINEIIQMKTHYPFFEFITKNEQQKGHPQSLNMLWQNINTKFVMHFEDDWLCRDIFSINEIIKDIILLNIDHIVLKRNCRGEHVNIKNKLWKYVYNPKNYLKPFENKLYDIDFMKKHNINSDDFYGHESIDSHWWWPGFSLNPCIFDFAKYKKIGKFDETGNLALFEYDFALRCYFAGLKTYFIDLNIEHIGNISSYSLNKTYRYYDPVL